MNIERLGPVGEDGKDKKTSKASPDSKAFEELMKIGQVKEPELDEKKKKKLVKEEEGEEEEVQAPPDVEAYKEQERALAAKEDVPSSHEFWAEADLKKIDPTKKAKALKTLSEEIKKEKNAPYFLSSEAPGKISSERLKEKKEALLSIEESAKQKLSKEKAALSEKARMIQEASLDLTKKEIEKKAFEKGTEKAIREVKEKKAKKVIEKNEIEKKEIKKITSSLKETKEPSMVAQTFEIPQNIAHQTEMITAKVESFLNPELVPIFEHMIGSLFFLEKKGMSSMTVILDNEKFASSRFYGSKITFEKYSTAPNSYNIRLTGSQEAVTIFNDNLDGLYKTLQKADLDFDVGRVYAEYDQTKPLFKRKPKIGKDEGNEI